MKTIILTCSGATADGEPERFIIEIDENTGDAQIVRESAARIDRDRSAHLGIQVGDRSGYVRLAVEAA